MLDSEPTTLSCGCNLAFTLAGSKKERRKLAEAFSGHTQQEDLSKGFFECSYVLCSCYIQDTVTTIHSIQKWLEWMEIGESDSNVWECKDNL